MTNPAPDPAALGGPGGLDVRLARPRLTPTGTRRDRLRRRLETAALKSSDKAAAALDWLWQQVRESKNPREQRLCAATALQHMREMAKRDADAGVEAAARVLVIAPEALRRLLGSPSGADDIVDSLRALAAPAPVQGLPGPAEGHA